jgi:acyl carrier protein
MDSQPSEQLKTEIKQLIIDSLKIPDVKAEQILSGASLFEEGNALQLDSVDALEIVMALQRKYGVHFDDQNISRFIIRSVDTIAEFIHKKITETPAV